MNRIIKFRAWNGKYMIDTSYGDWIAFDGVPYTQASQRFDTPNIEIQKVKDYILMQFTGLKDKNGIEIYEGDICLKYHNKELYGDREPTKGVIEWVSFRGRYTHKSIEKYPSYCEIHENLKYPEYERSLFEVIGNIYQNPELL